MSPSPAVCVALALVGCSAERGLGEAQGGAVIPRSDITPAADAVASPDAVAPGGGPTVAAVAPASVPSTRDAMAVEAPSEALWPPSEQFARGFPTPRPGARIYSKSRHLWIRSAPGGGEDDWMGYLSLGDSVRLKDGDPLKARVMAGQGMTCREWYAVEPRGYVCVGTEATLDPDDPEVDELIRTRADHTSPWPYRYGESLGAPIRLEVPASPGQPADPAAAGALRLFPKNPFVRSLFTHIAAGSTVAYTDALDVGGAPHLMTWDRGLVKRADVKPYPESHFHGLPLGPDLALPVGFVRSDSGATVLRRNDAGVLEPTGETLPRLAWVGLTGKTEGPLEAQAYETRDGRWIRGGELGVATKATALPLTLGRSKGRRTWVDISLTNGTLVAYEGETPVYVTLISPGRGGPPVPGKTTLETASTPTGLFAVLGKFVTATMVSSTVSTLVHTEVQYPQNFDGPYSLHGAYWHDRWGLRKSAGCVNLAPVDSRRLYAWTDPPVPEGWHGIRSAVDPGPRTLVNIRR
ncbi:MAG: L,D-transpeptidase [Deltaproteobacteria bacterium]|nr:L,D-transpeptidase [Deltaproteobacteria bacterium]